jgi:hypothetical protein
MTRAVVAAVLVLAAVAAADAIRSASPGTASTTPETRITLNPHGLIRDDRSQPITRRFIETHALRPRRVVLTPEQIDAAFPARLSGRLQIRDIAIAPDGTVVVAAVRFPRGLLPRGALEFWRDGRLAGAFTLAAAKLSPGGLGFSSNGRFVAVYSRDRTRATLFDRRGNAVASLAVRGG